jgi:Skp family chaperone for outer membrane proteins
MAQIQQQLTLVTQEIAAERKLDIVLAKATIVLVRPELELTDAALALLNQRLPRVQLPELERQ